MLLLAEFEFAMLLLLLEFEFGLSFGSTAVGTVTALACFVGVNSEDTVRTGVSREHAFSCGNALGNFVALARWSNLGRWALGAMFDCPAKPLAVLPKATPKLLLFGFWTRPLRCIELHGDTISSQKRIFSFLSFGSHKSTTHYELNGTISRTTKKSHRTKACFPLLTSGSSF